MSEVASTQRNVKYVSLRCMVTNNFPQLFPIMLRKDRLKKPVTLLTGPQQCGQKNPTPFLRGLNDPTHHQNS